jgi:glycosyltransferase involved in cell wall biosynthesis
MGRHPLSVAIVCQDEEDRIGAALASVAFADEIVVVDSGSRDRTLEIVKGYTDRVYAREWKGWKDQKSWAAAQCRHEWVLTLDADEVVSPELRAAIAAVLGRETIGENGFQVPRRTFYQGRWIRHCGWYPDHKLRLYRKEAAGFGGDDPHEVISVPAPVGTLTGDLLHYTYRDLRHQAQQLLRYALVNAEARYARGERFHLSGLIFGPLFAAFKSYLLQRGFQDGLPGLVISVMNGFYTFLKYARLWELSRGVK